MPPSSTWYQRHALLPGLGLFILIQWIAFNFLLPGPAKTWGTGGEIADEVLKTTQLKGIQNHANPRQYSTALEQGLITWLDGTTTGLVSFSINIQFNGADTSSQWILQYTTSQDPFFDEGMIHTRSLRPIIRCSRNETSLAWNLPTAAKNIRLIVPPHSRFSVELMHLSGIAADQTLWHTWRQALIVFCFVINLSLFLSWILQYLPVFRKWLSNPAGISTLILGMHGLTIIWLMPPFQGPDENRHWKEAVRLFRSDGQPGSVLYRLPIILDAESLRWRSELPFRAANFHAPVQVHREDEDNKRVSYVKHWGFPVVGFVSLLFPQVNTVNEAILFFYTCRVLNLLLLLSLVAAAWKLGMGSWTLVIFLSFPVVMQQCVIVSTDTVHNLGTFLAVLLFRRHQLVKTRTSWLLLFLSCCLVVFSKPPIYLFILLVPAWFSPRAELRRPVVWISLVMGVLAIGAIGLWFLWRILDGEGMGLGAHARMQLDYILSGPGLERFFFAGMEYPTRFIHPFYWWQPMGWLDTNISEFHEAILWISLFLALIYDLTRLFRFWPLAVVEINEGFFITIVFSLLHFLFVWWSLALIMYLTISDFQSTGIVGMQVRYMIPCFLLTLLWPACFVQPSKISTRISWQTFAGISLLFLAVARAAQLAADLMIRYW